MKILLIYHKEDNDGVFSGGLFYNYFINAKQMKSQDVIPYGADYNMMNILMDTYTAKDLHQKYDKLILTDISFKDTYMKSLADEFGEDFIWCDHHAPIIKAAVQLGFDNVPGVRDTTRSAILCVYKFLYDRKDKKYEQRKNPEKFPWLLYMLSTFDAWRHEAEGIDFDTVRYINKGVTYETNKNMKVVVETILKPYFINNRTVTLGELMAEQYKKIGETLCKYDDQQYEELCMKGGDKTWTLTTSDGETRKVCVVVSSNAVGSIVFDSLKKSAVKNGAIIKRNSDGNWTLSLYNVDEHDTFHCGNYLKEHYNGGGHVGAAGCQLTEDQFIDLLKSKKI